MRTNGGKSADHIPFVLLKMMPRKGKAFLLNIFNSSSRLNYFPAVWKDAVVVPLLKPKKKGHETDHYRPISLLTHMSKIYVKLLLSKILIHCEEKAILPPDSSECRPTLLDPHSRYQ